MVLLQQFRLSLILTRQIQYQSSGNDYSIAIVITAFILAILVGLVVIGGIQRISKVSQIIVPFMAVLYIVVCLVLIIVNINKVPSICNNS